MQEDCQGYTDTDEEESLLKRGFISRTGRNIQPKRRLEDEEHAPVTTRRFKRVASSDSADNVSSEQSAKAKATHKATIGKRLSPLTWCKSQTEECNLPSTDVYSASDSDKAAVVGKAGGVFKTAAVQVLRSTGRLMSTGEITRLAVKMGCIHVQGKTPDATMASALYTDIKKKEDLSAFIKPHEGLFGLREWWDMGHQFVDPKEVVDIKHYPVGIALTALSEAVSRSAAACQKSARSSSSRCGQERRSGWSRDTVQSFVDASPSTSPQQKYRSSMDVLFAAVDELSKGDAASTSSDSAVGDAQRATSKLENHASASDHLGFTTVKPQVTLRPMHMRNGGLHPERRCHQSALPVEAAQDLGGQGEAISENSAGKLFTATQAEVLVQSLECSLQAPPAMLMQAYMHLSKMYGEAGMLEKACSHLAKAMEIGDATGIA